MVRKSSKNIRRRGSKTTRRLTRPFGRAFTKGVGDSSLRAAFGDAKRSQSVAAA
jgi:hypothetical protein